MSSKKIVVALTGASGSIYAVRLVESLLMLEHEVHLTASTTAVTVFALEQKLNKNEQKPGKNVEFPAMFRSILGRQKEHAKITFHAVDDFSAKIASGSFPTDGMVVVPCSSGSLGAIASGVNRHLIHRAAEVHLKERRKLILVFRETPYSLVHIENMGIVTRAGAVVLPASPPFYHQPETIYELVDAVVVRILDQLGLEHPMETGRWKDSQ